MKTQQFIAALRQIEDDGNLEPMIQLFADDASIWNPELACPMIGRDGAREFWKAYRGTFATVHSTFRDVIEGQDKSALEWESAGKLEATHDPFHYRGVSIMDWLDDHIVRFAAYFDPRALAASPSYVVRAAEMAS